MPIPIVTVNAWSRSSPAAEVPRTSLIDCDMADRSAIDSVILMERGEPFAELPTLDATVDRLLTNTDDAYTFPPFASFSKLIAIGGRDYETLRARERELLTHVGRARLAGPGPRSRPQLVGPDPDPRPREAAAARGRRRRR